MYTRVTASETKIIGPEMQVEIEYKFEFDNVGMNISAEAKRVVSNGTNTTFDSNTDVSLKDVPNGVKQKVAGHLGQCLDGIEAEMEISRQMK